VLIIGVLIGVILSNDDLQNEIERQQQQQQQQGG